MADTRFDLVAADIATSLARIDAPTYGFLPLVRRIGRKASSKGVSAEGDTYEVEIEIRQMKWESQQPREMGQSFHVLHFELACFVELSDSSNVPTDSISNQIYSAVMVALMADAQRSGLAEDTFVEGAETFAKADGSYYGIAIHVSVQMMTDQFNPFAP